MRANRLIAERDVDDVGHVVVVAHPGSLRADSIIDG
jgi:hypothetical protein